MGEIASIVYKPHQGPQPRNDYLRIEVSEATLVAGHGIEGDRKASRNRQLNVMSFETLKGMVEEGFQTQPGKMGEQIVIRQLDVNTLPLGAKLQLGSEAVIEMIEARTGCSKFERVQLRTKQQAEGRLGMMARVLAGGKIRVGDVVRVLG